MSYSKLLEKNVKVTEENLALCDLQLEIDLQLENRRLHQEVAEPKNKTWFSASIDLQG